MNFNSIEFLIFLLLVFTVYWAPILSTSNLQNLVLLISGCFFYGLIDYRFLLLLIGTKVIDFYCSLGIFNSTTTFYRRFFLYLSLLINVGSLIFFKYFNSFIEQFYFFFQNIGIEFNHPTLNVILPLGFSFYTFQTIGYIIDVYQEKEIPTRNPLEFLTFICFFPTILSGPIERASNLLNQLKLFRVFNYENAVQGLRQILWGLFKKFLIADNLAVLVDSIFNNYTDFNGATLLLALFLFSFQIYYDFSGYSDIAIGTARLFNINLSINFNYPYFSQNISEFWQRWHISLSTWLFDYIFKPIQFYFRDYQKFGNVFAIFVTFGVSGIWHGTGWNYIFWGLLNAFFYIPIIFRWPNIYEKILVNKFPTGLNLIKYLNIISTFLLINLAWLFFRSSSIYEAFSYLGVMFNNLLEFDSNIRLGFKNTLIILSVPGLIIFETILQSESNLIHNIVKNRLVRYLVYYLVILALVFFSGKTNNFIYFNF